MSEAIAPPKRRRLQFGLAAAIVMLTLCAIVMAWAVKEPGPSVPDLSRPIKQVRLILGTSPKTHEMLISDPRLIEKLVVVPLRRARRDPQPAGYIYLGFASIEFGDGTKDGINLFLPWGHFKHGETYGIADFSPLHIAARQSLPRAPRYFFEPIPE